MGSRVYEDMVRVQFARWTIRAWMRVDLWNDIDVHRWKKVESQILQIAAKFVFESGEANVVLILGETGSCRALVHMIADQVEGCAAVEVLDEHGNGSVAYNDWP